MMEVSSIQRQLQARQAAEWAELIRSRRAAGGHLIISPSHDRHYEGSFLSGSLSARSIPLDALQPWSHALKTEDVVVVLAGLECQGKAGCLPENCSHPLHPAVRRGAVVLGLTGPRPNGVAEHCHDSMALEISDPDELLQAHRAALLRLVPLLSRPALSIPPSEAV